MHQHARYSNNDRVDEVVRTLIDGITDANPYNVWDRERYGSRTTADIIELIAHCYGPRAAASVRLTLH